MFTRRRGAGFARRVGARGVGGGRLSPVVLVSYVGGFTSNWRYESANTGHPGSATMSRCLVWIPTAVPTANGNLHGYGATPATARGWAFDYGNTGLARFWIANVVPTSIMSPTYQIVAGDVGKVFITFGTYDGTTLRYFMTLAGVVTEVGTGTLAAGYTAPLGTDEMAIGNVQGATRPAIDGGVIATAGSDTDVWTLGEMQAIADNVKLLGSITTAVPTELYRFRADTGVVPPGTWTADSGGINLAQAGTVPAMTKTTVAGVFR